MNRIKSMKDVADVMLELPAGIVPYEEYDFEPYFEEHKSEEELRKTWRVFTKVKDVLDDGFRLENASWRMWFKERSRTGAAPTIDESAQQMSDLELTSMSLESSLRSAEQSTTRMAGQMFSGGMDKKFEQESELLEQRAKAERTRALIDLAEKHGIDPAVVDDIMGWVHSAILHPVAASGAAAAADESKPASAILPSSFTDAQRFLEETQVVPRPRVAAFCHSLERNGANNFLLYLLRELKDELSFDVYSPKEGAMRTDYEAMKMPVHILDMKLASYPDDVRKVLSTYGYAIANTIMTTEVINAAKELSVPCLWVIHEAWPQHQFDYYAKEVFMMTHLDGNAIIQAFANASKLVFPANVQQSCYKGLFKPENSRVIYNGIPLASINTFRAVQSRDKVRAELGYSPNDILLVHMGTVCRRKGQHVTSAAFSRLMRDVDPGEGKQFKLLMVGARYIRQHEIDYIDGCKQTLEEGGALEHTTILDVKKHVLPYYLSADIVLCPSLNEVLPLVICEAMAFERPVIASRIDGIPEALTDGIEGLLIEPDSTDALFDAISSIAMDVNRRKEMGAAGRARVLDQFSFGTMSKAYRDCIAIDIATPPAGKVDNATARVLVK
jgi:glycosyltransferase involved in cell wall biosynthesis